MRIFKFKLNRQALETIYISFIRPTLEYADIIWDNCTQQQEQELEKVQLEAARIVTGTTKLVSLNKIYTETGWDTLKERRRKHKLILFYKMNSGLAPDYLSSLVPENVAQLVNYNLRNSNNTRRIQCKTQLYAKSFLPSSIQEWNKLPQEIKCSSSLRCFKSNLNLNVIKPPKNFYFYTNRKSHIMHTRLRTHCSALNQHLHSKNIIDNPYCTCGAIEDTYHFLFECLNYVDHRRTMNNVLVEFGQLSLNILLFGDASLPFDQNVKLFEAVQSFISSTNRF